MKFYRRLAISLAIMFLLPVNAYVMANEDKKESQEKPFYVGVFGGYSFPQDAHLRPSDPTPGIDIKGGLSGGLKTGWMLPGQTYGGWFNWEFEYWYQNNRVKQQTFPGIGTLSGANGHVHIFSSNFILRRPTGKIQPYVGLGPSLVYADVNGSDSTTSALGTGNQSATSFGLNFLVGTRVMFTDTLGMFVEYKRNTAFNAAFDDGGRYRFTTNAVAGGVTWDFESITLP
jgi:hypothetical protein